MGTGFCVPNRAHPNPANTLSVDAAACPRNSCNRCDSPKRHVARWGLASASLIERIPTLPTPSPWTQRPVPVSAIPAMDQAASWGGPPGPRRTPSSGHCMTLPHESPAQANPRRSRSGAPSFPRAGVLARSRAPRASYRIARWVSHPSTQANRSGDRDRPIRLGIPKAAGWGSRASAASCAKPASRPVTFAPSSILAAVAGA